MSRLSKWILSFCVFFYPEIASAHAFGQNYSLPLPVNFYITGGVCAFIASCAILLLFSEPTPESGFRTVPTGVRIPRFVQIALATLGVAGFVFSIALAFLGTQDYITNPLPNLFWIIYLLLFTYITLVLAGLWQYLDPFRRIARVAAPQEGHAVPQWLMYLPIAWLYILLWFELFSGGLGAIPIAIGVFLLAIAAIANIGGSIYGIQEWFEKADFFTAFFSLVGKISPLQIHDDHVTIMWPGERLVRERAEHLSILLFTLVLLGATVLDGLRETKFWYQFLQPFPYTWDNYIGLGMIIFVPAALFAFYSLCILWMRRSTGTTISFRELLLRFAFSLVPIALAYHFAHYFALILGQGQAFVAQISDPFAKGWNIFGTAGYKMNPGLVGADTVWYIQLSVIVFGHILAAIVAHYIAQRTFSTKYQVVVSQLPMLFLMVCLTAFGLWTLSQPFAAS